MTLLPLDDEDSRERDEHREEWLDMVERKEIAEGDISVSETQTGHDPQPDLDDNDADIDDLGNLIDEDAVIMDTFGDVPPNPEEEALDRIDDADERRDGG